MPINLMSMDERKQLKYIFEETKGIWNVVEMDYFIFEINIHLISLFYYQNWMQL